MSAYLLLFSAAGGSAAPAPNVLVSGAGTTTVNGTYTPRGTFNGRTFYNLLGQPTSLGVFSIHLDMSGFWFISDEFADQYASTDGVPTANPWQAVWGYFSGSPPLPIVTQA